MYYFKGTIKRFLYTEFFSVDAFSKTTGGCPPELDAVGDPIPCEQIAIDVSNASGGSGEEGGGAGDSNVDGDFGSIGDSSTCTYSIGTNWSLCRRRYCCSFSRGLWGRYRGAVCGLYLLPNKWTNKNNG